jgi:hypothetical protein
MGVVERLIIHRSRVLMLYKTPTRSEMELVLGVTVPDQADVCHFGSEAKVQV